MMANFGRSDEFVKPKESGVSDQWTTATAAQGRVGSQRITKAGEEVSSVKISGLLNLETGEKVVVRQRIILLDGQPVELADSYYPSKIAADTALVEPKKIRGGAVTLLAGLGYSADRLEEDVTARLPDEAEQELLEIGPHEAVLDITRVIFTQDGEPFEVNTMVMVGKDRTLHYTKQVGE